MDAEAPQPLPVKENLRIRRALIVWVAVVFLILVPLVLSRRTRPAEKFVWLTPSQMATTNNQGPLERFRWWAMKLPGPLGKLFRYRGPIMSIGANMTGIPEEASRRIVIGPPLATNANGTLAWLLSEGDLASLRQQFGHVQNLASFPGGRITTFTGTQAAMTVGGQSPLNAKTGSVSNLLVGMQMDMTARIEFRSIRLVASFVSTDLSLSGSNAYSVVTNASVCASALCPNGGALVCNIPGTDQNHGTNFWIIISTTATDSKGVKIRL